MSTVFVCCKGKPQNINFTFMNEHGTYECIYLNTKNRIEKIKKHIENTQVVSFGYTFEKLKKDLKSNECSVDINECYLKVFYRIYKKLDPDTHISRKDMMDGLDMDVYDSEPNYPQSNGLGTCQTYELIYNAMQKPDALKSYGISL